MPKHELLIDFGSGLLVAADDRFSHNHMRIIDPVDHSTAWESSSIESIEAVTPSTVIALTANRKYDSERKSYSLKSGNLRGFDRKNGRIRWSMPLADVNLTLVAFAQFDDVLAVVDRLSRYDPTVGDARLFVLNPDTGTVLSQRVGRFRDLLPFRDSLAVLEEANNSSDSEFYVCKLPQCAKENPILLSAKEILRMRLYGEYILTAGIYDSACFERSTGRRLWEKGQLEWSEPFDDEMVVADFSSIGQSAQIVSVALRSGEGRVLFSRKITPHDRASFRPW